MLALKPYTRYTLSYLKTTGYTTDAKGNRVPVTAARTLEVVLEPKDAARMVYRTGADEGEIPVDGACYNPRLMPREITNGQEFEFVFDGRPATLTVRLLPRRALAKLDLKLGQQFEGTVRY